MKRMNEIIEYRLEFKEGPADCIRINEVAAAIEKDEKTILQACKG